MEAGTNFLKIVKTGLAVFLLAAIGVANLRAQPPNDNFANAIALGTNTLAGSDLNASLEANEPHISGVTNTVWWSWTAPSTGLAWVDLDGGTSGNYFVNLFTGDTVSNLTLIQPITSLTTIPITYDVHAGTTYDIQVSGYDGSNISISMQPDGMTLSNIQTTLNSDNSTSFSYNLAVANSGVNFPSFEIDVVARAGYSATQEWIDDGVVELPPDTLLGSYYVTNLAPAAVKNILLTNTCPPPYVEDSINLGYGWDVFVVFTGSYQKSVSLLSGAWPSISGDTNAGGEVVRYDPPAPTNVPDAQFKFVSGTINGPATVDENSSTNFYGSVNITNGYIATTINLANAYWTISPGSPFTIDSNGVFACGLVATNTPVTITAYYSLNGTNYLISTNFTVIVIPAPAISNQPASEAIGYGEPVEFSVAATGHPPLFYQWNFDGAPLPGATNSAFDLAAAQLNNSGTYSVVVSNSVGIATSTNFVLAVAETVPPTVDIVSPVSSGTFHTLNFSIPVSGIAFDLVGLTQVFISENGGPYQLVQGTTNWSATISLTAGTNIISVKSVNLSSLVSPVASITVIVDASPGPDGLSLVTNGAGGITHAAWPKELISGKKYTLTAVPRAGNLFSNWMGGTSYPYAVLSTAAKYTFTFAPGLLLEGNFVTNPYVAMAGIYNGIFTNTSGVNQMTAGMLKGLSITTKGTYTGALLVNGASHTISGSFNLAGQATNFITRGTGAAGTLTLTLSVTNSSNAAPQIVGAVSGIANNVPWSSPLTADRAANATPPVNYTMLIEPDRASAPFHTTPGADGYALITDSKGAVKISGTLADGTAFSQSVNVSSTGDVPIYASLYKNKGLLLGWINLDPTNSPGSGLAWFHPAATAGLFPSEFTATNPIALSAWTNPPANSVLAGLTALSVADPIPGSVVVTNNFTIAINGYDKVEGTSGAEELSGAFAPKTGLLTLTLGSGATKVTGHAVILPNATNGGGFFLTKTNVQSIRLGQ